MNHIVTITGAFKNAGDYLIGDRARKLLAANTDAKIVDLNRRAIRDHHYEVLSSARAVLLTGGPAYRSNIYPNIYKLDLSRVQAPVLAYGLGWRGELGQLAKDFRFEPAAADFVESIHANKNLFSSARDHLTVEMLNAQGIKNVAMTGCPTWYDYDYLWHDYEFNPNVKKLVFSMPAQIQPMVPHLIADLSKRFPKAKKYLSFQAGYQFDHAKEKRDWHIRMLAKAIAAGFRPVSFESNFEKFEKVMSSIDLHVGYRVHSHIFSVSQRKTSLLIAEDSRGIGQVEALGSTALPADGSIQSATEALDKLFDSRGESIVQAVAKIRETHPKMLSFLEQL
jgi:hypothetical protein